MFSSVFVHRIIITIVLYIVIRDARQKFTVNLFIFYNNRPFEVS